MKGKSVKFLAVMTMVLALAFVSGCACTRADSTTGVITKNATNCLLTAQDIVCNASADTLANANLLATLLKSLANTYIAGSTEYTVYITAQNIIDLGCSTVTGLNELIAYLQSSKGKSLMVAAKAGPMGTVVNVQPFIDWRAGKNWQSFRLPDYSCFHAGGGRTPAESVCKPENL